MRMRSSTLRTQGASARTEAAWAKNFPRLPLHRNPQHDFREVRPETVAMK
jgi:hypothetical protein